MQYEILEDKRRLTVAVTRAKEKLILLADVATIKEYTPFLNLFQGVASENFIKLDDHGLDWNTVSK